MRAKLAIGLAVLALAVLAITLVVTWPPTPPPPPPPSHIVPLWVGLGHMPPCHPIGHLPIYCPLTA
jgi:hypothetical protein